VGKRDAEGDRDLKSGCTIPSQTTAKMFTGLVNNLSRVIVASVYSEGFVDRAFGHSCGYQAR
jgi:hypothetical protein